MPVLPFTGKGSQGKADDAPSVDQGGGGGDDGGDMEARISKLEALAEKTGARLAAIETRLTKIEMRSENVPTKAELAEATGSLEGKIGDAKASIIMWVVGTVLLAQVIAPVLKKLGWIT